jgi:hypothetical protein
MVMPINSPSTVSPPAAPGFVFGLTVAGGFILPPARYLNIGAGAGSGSDRFFAGDVRHQVFHAHERKMSFNKRHRSEDFFTGEFCATASIEQKYDSIILYRFL